MVSAGVLPHSPALSSGGVRGVGHYTRRGSVPTRPLPQFGQGCFQLGQLDGLEQIGDAVGLKGADGVLVVGGGEDDGAVHHNLGKYVEAQAIGQLDVAQDEAGRGVGG
jgi:hypothetical protein